MSRINFIAASMILWLASGVALAQDFWTSKDVLKWSDDEVHKMMSDSPWGRDVTVTLAPAGDSNAKGSETLTLNISWLSSLPIKQAMLKTRFDEGSVVAKSAQEILDTE